MYKRRRPGCGAQPAVTTPESATKGRRAEAAEAVGGPPAGVRSASIKNEARAKRRDPPFALVHNTGGPRPDMAHHLVLIDKSRPPKLTHTFSSYLPPPPPPHLPDRRQATPISRTPVLPDPALAQAAHLCACPMVTCHQTILPDSQVCPHCPPGNTQHHTHFILSSLARFLTNTPIGPQYFYLSRQ
ncbi:hypothetical protein Pcinc_017089 [Petrolisthes cinctipes]|uniref:Uncharacterized protein n=1 Tax=Petrolisthes cinctipes TaxID=88211 RepID=A0AAE1FQW3_PETCI|nr:hypothetical protein Pcinc_017089 [Petrolisthes cinctipes]